MLWGGIGPSRWCKSILTLSKQRRCSNWYKWASCTTTAPGSFDPADVQGEDYPAEIFRVHKNKELREFGEYRTQRLVLAAWDALESLK